MTVRSDVRAARFRNRRLFAWRMALAAFRLLGMFRERASSWDGNSGTQESSDGLPRLPAYPLEFRLQAVSRHTMPTCKGRAPTKVGTPTQKKAPLSCDFLWPTQRFGKKAARLRRHYIQFCRGKFLIA